MASAIPVKAYDHVSGIEYRWVTLTDAAAATGLQSAFISNRIHSRDADMYYGWSFKRDNSYAKWPIYPIHVAINDRQRLNKRLEGKLLPPLRWHPKTKERLFTAQEAYEWFGGKPELAHLIQGMREFKPQSTLPYVPDILKIKTATGY